MAWSAGSFNRSNGVHSGASTWADDAAAGTGITTGRHDVHDEDLADGIDACLTKDGANSPSAHLTWVKANYWGGTSGGSANAQTVSLSPALSAYAAGNRIVFIAGFTNTGAATLNVNGLGAKNLRLFDNSIALIGGEIIAGGVYDAVYDGTQFLLMNGKSETLILDRVTTQTIVASTTTETTIYTKSVGANLMGTKRALRLNINGTWFNNTGSADVHRVRIKFGSTTMLDSSSNILLNSSASSRPYRLTAVIAPNNSASAQRINGEVIIWGPTGGGTLIVANPGAGVTATAMGYGTASEDTTSAKTLAVTIQPTTSSANLTWNMDNATLELL